MARFYWDLQQGSAAWFAARSGIPTASEFASIITPKKMEMAEAFDEVQERLVTLSSQRPSNDAELQRVRLALASASIGPAREELNRREARLVTLQGQLQRLQAGLNCMQAPVPDDAVTRLNRVSTSRPAAR